MNLISLSSRGLRRIRLPLVAMVVWISVSLNGAPEIVMHPESQNVFAGDSVTISVSADGEDLTFQWWWHGSKIPGETASTLTIDPISLADAGSYTVTVVNSLSETVESAPAQLVVAPTPEPTSVKGPTTTEFSVESAKSTVTTIKPLPDGRYYLAGDFDSVNGIVRGPLVRFLADGTVDTTFQSPLGEGDSVVGVVLQEDGKLVVGGNFSWRTGEYSDPETKSGWNLVRLNPDGSIDGTFRTRGFHSNLTSLSTTADGRLMVTGGFESYRDDQGRAIPRYKFAVLHADGSLDETVIPKSTVLVPLVAVQLANGRFLIGGGFRGAELQCLESDGSLVESFTAPFNQVIGQFVFDLIPLVDGGAVVAGALGASGESQLWRIDPDGRRDLEFAVPGEIPFSSISLVESARDGGYWVASRHQAVSSSAATMLKLDASGSLVDSFSLKGESGLKQVTALWEGTNEQVFLGGKTNDGDSLDYAIANATTGSLESSSALVLGATSDVWTVEVAGPDEWWVGGDFDRVNGIPTDGLVKVNSAGEVVATYDLGWTESSSVSNILRMADGGLLVAGRFYISRRIPDQAPLGTADHLVRITADGQLDPEFPLAVSSSHYTGSIVGGGIRDLARSSSGDIILMGDFNSVQGQSRDGLAILTPEGLLNPDFDPGHTGISPSRLHQVDIDSQGRVYVRGNFTAFGESHVRSVVRLLPNGSVDSTFEGLPSTANDGATMMVDSSDRLWAALENVFTSSYEPAVILRFQANGKLDNNFAPERIELVPFTLTEQANGKVLVGGLATGRTTETEYERLVRLNEDGTTDPSFMAVGMQQRWGSVTVLNDGSLFLTRHPQYLNSEAPRFGITEARQAPRVVAQPNGGLAQLNGEISLSVAATGEGISLQWRRNGEPISGAMDSILTLTPFGLNNVGNYDIVATDAFGPLVSDTVWVGLAPIDSDLTGDYAVRGRGYVPGRRIVIANAITPRSQQDNLKLQFLLPNGWGYLASNEPEASTAPEAGHTQLLEWEWANTPATTLEFDFVLQVPAEFTGNGEIVGLLTEGSEESETQTLMRPDPLRIEQASHTHTADSNADHQIDLSELLRVIEIYNTRSGTNRTGRYQPDLSTADGFVPDTRTESSEMITYSHSADTNRDGQLSLSELLRVIELYNSRSGTNRTGAYQSAEETVDGFAPNEG